MDPHDPPPEIPPPLSREAFAAGTLELERVLALLEGHALTSLGRRVVREVAPLPEEEARAALARVREVEGLEKARDLPGLAGVTDPRALLEAAQRGPLGEEELGRLVALLEAAERTGHWLERREGDVPALGALARELPDLSGLRDGLLARVDERGRLREDASPVLARLVRERRDLERRIERALGDVLKRAELRSVLADTRTHRRGGRPCVAVKAKSGGRVRGVLLDRSQSEQTIYVEPNETVPLSNRLAELLVEERREIARVLGELTRDVLGRAADLERAGEALGKLELALVARRWAAGVGAVVPRLPGEPGAPEELRLVAARHPLLIEEQCRGTLAEVVPIDLRLGGDFDMLIITGPNTGGKTVALKTAGLAALMVRCGLPFPCAPESGVPFYDGIAADIGDEQEISQSLSTFSSHLVRIRAMLARADERTLCLLDELGGGTDPDEGAALGEAICEELLSRRAPTLVSTHLGRLKEFAWRHARAENACTEFDLETLAPRYRLIVGVPGESAALAVARRLGLDPRVVAAAEERTERREEEVAQLLADVRAARVETERVRTEVESRLREAERGAEAVRERERELAERGARLEAEAQRDLEERLRTARGHLERAERLLAQVPAESREELARALADLRGALGGASLTERRRAFLESLKKGVLVYVPRFKQRCVVHKVDRERGEAIVKLGAMKMRVSLEEVTPFESL